MAGTHHPANGDPPREGNAALRTAGLRKDTHCPPDRKGPQRPGTKDCQRPGNPQQVRRWIGRKNQGALCGGREGTAGNGRQFHAAHCHYGRDGRHLQAARDRQGRDGCLRFGSQPASEQDRWGRLPQQHSIDRNDESKGHDRRRPLASGTSGGTRGDRSAGYQGPSADSQHPHPKHENRQAHHLRGHQEIAGAGGKSQEFFRCRAGGSGQGGQFLCAGPMPGREGPQQGARHQEFSPAVRRL
mmetsp:Transcript_12020/g.25397  ORF Transcript_12020/g.25397 Transcript_12020/m.25397 type:complete len:242 (-) Transcript_12020:1319-2044(-)